MNDDELIKSIRFLQPGEYDLVNISLLGFDPVTRKSFDECNDLWRQRLEALERKSNTLRWWNVFQKCRLYVKASALAQQQGLY